MATSVEVDNTISRIERLRAEIRLRTGTRPTQQELLARMVERTIESREGLVDSFRDDSTLVPANEREAFHEGMVASGVATSEEDIDDTLYE